MKALIRNWPMNHTILIGAKASTTTLDLYSQSIDAAKLEAQEDIALAITSTAAVD